jgi:hypothetical protein
MAPIQTIIAAAIAEAQRTGREEYQKELEQLAPNINKIPKRYGRTHNKTPNPCAMTFSPKRNRLLNYNNREWRTSSASGHNATTNVPKWGRSAMTNFSNNRKKHERLRKLMPEQS